MEYTILELIKSPNRQLINKFSLNHFQTYNEIGDERNEEYPILLKSCMLFCYKVFNTDRAMFQLLNDNSGNVLPWNGSERMNWLPMDFLKPKSDHLIKLWLSLLTKWYEIFFQNPFLYLKWTEGDGYGWYWRFFVQDAREVLESPVFANSSFLQSITVVEMQILSAFGFESFFRYRRPGSEDFEYCILFGFWMMANSALYGIISRPCSLVFKNSYERKDANDPDCIIGQEYRTTVSWYRKVETMEISDNMAIVDETMRVLFNPVSADDIERMLSTGLISEKRVLYAPPPFEDVEIGFEETYNEIFLRVNVVCVHGIPKGLQDYQLYVNCYIHTKL